LKRIIDKNLEIAEKTFSEKSIHLLYHYSSTFINRIALGEITSPSQANPFIKKIRLIITNWHDGNAANLNNQLFFQIQLLYAQLLNQLGPNDNLNILRVVSEVYTHVISAQARYCKMNMRHPFLEQTFFNIAIFNRGLKKMSEALLMFKRLEALQKDLYGEESQLLVITWKNIGTCYLGVGQSEQAENYFKQCIVLINKLGK